VDTHTHTTTPRQLEELEETYRQKIAAEVDRYDALIAQRDTSNTAWDRENTSLIAAHDKLVARMKRDHEEYLAEEQVPLLLLFVPTAYSDPRCPLSRAVRAVYLPAGLPMPCDAHLIALDFPGAMCNALGCVTH
jgi:hypothetical protein